MKAIVLLSGGLDSCVAASVALSSIGRAPARSLTALAVHYGQRHSIELDAASAVADALNLSLTRVDARLDVFGRNALTSTSVAPSRGRSVEQITSDARPSTFVPARNAVLLSLAASFAASCGAVEVWIGSNRDDASGYPDCRPEFFRAFEATSRAGGFPITVRHPLTELSKRDVARLGRSLSSPIHLTWSCYDPQGSMPCDTCDACVLRREALA